MRRTLMLVALAAALTFVVIWLGGGMDRLGIWAQTAQRGFQNQMALGLRALRTGEPGALAAFWGLCFAYGFVHAVGPGHGKFLLGAYGAGKDVALRQMIGIGFLASLAQGASAVALVYGGVLIFNASREALQIAGDVWLERASLIAIALIGLWLVGRALRKLMVQTVAAPMLAAGPVAQGVCEDCGHRHGPELHEIEHLTSWRDAAMLIGAIAIRPCTGALFVLILTWRMDLIWQGIAAVLAMALGTAAVTVAVAGTAVLAREGAMTWASKLPSARWVMPGLEALAGIFILMVALNMLKII